MGIDVKSEKDKKYEEDLSLIDDYFNRPEIKKMLNNATFGLIPGSDKELLFENSEMDADEFLYLPEDEKLKDLINVYKDISKKLK